MNAPDLPSLPDKLEQEMQALKQVQPPPALVNRAFAQLSNVPQAKSVSTKRQSKFVYIPVVAMAMAALGILVGRQFVPQTADLVRVEERELSLPESGHAWTALDLQTHHHDDLPAVVHLEVPTHVRVQLPATASSGGEQIEKHCAEARCIHRFTQHHGKGVPLRIAVAHPGRYEIHVRHESKKAALREHYILTASRD